MAALAIFALLTALARAAGADGQASEFTVKAALLVRFAEFSEWPDLAVKAPVQLCVVGDDKIAAALTDLVRGHSVDEHPLEVRRSPDAAAWAGCQLLFVASGAIRGSAPGLSNIKTVPVLTVSDDKNFARTAGIIELYLESGRMRFAINVDAAGRAGVRLNSRVLGLAKVIKDGDR